MINYQQAMMALRWVLTAIGTALVSHGVGNAGIFEAVSGVIIAGAPFIWGMIRHTKIGTIIAADDLPEVAGVITKSTIEGAALASDTPKATVVPAGSIAAASIAGTR